MGNLSCERQSFFKRFKNKFEFKSKEKINGGLPELAMTLVLLLSLLAPQITNAACSIVNLKSVDAMKYTKDTVAGQQSDAAIGSIVDALALTGATHIAVSIPMDATTDYVYGRNPSPRTAEAFTQSWASAIHQRGLHIIWRGTWSGIEGIYNFPKLVGTKRFLAGTTASAPTDGQSTWLGKTYQYIVSHPTYFAQGDIWAPMPERTEGIFQDQTSFLPYSGVGIQANYANFFNGLKTVSDLAFARIGTAVTTGMTANNFTEVRSGWLPQSIFDTAGVTVVDYYGIAHTPQEMDADLRYIYSQHKKPVFLQEWGDYWDSSMVQPVRTAYLQSMYAEMQRLISDGVLAGFNYWGGWDNSAEGLLIRNGGSYQLNYRGQLLANFFLSGQKSQILTKSK